MRELMRDAGVLGWLAILLTVVLMPIILAALTSRHRGGAAALLLVLATLPLGLGLIGTAMGYAQMRRVIQASAGDASPAEWDHGARQAWKSSWVGGACTLLLLVAAGGRLLLFDDDEDAD